MWGAVRRGARHMYWVFWASSFVRVKGACKRDLLRAGCRGSWRFSHPQQIKYSWRGGGLSFVRFFSGWLPASLLPSSGRFPILLCC